MTKRVPNASTLLQCVKGAAQVNGAASIERWKGVGEAKCDTYQCERTYQRPKAKLEKGMVARKRMTTLLPEDHFWIVQVHENHGD